MLTAVAGCGSGSSARTGAAAAAPSPTSSAAAGVGDPFTGARAADATMPPLADLLGTGLAKSAGWSGNAASPAADLRAKLTFLFTEHTHLLGMVFAAIDTKGPSNSVTKAAQAALDANSAAVIAEIAAISHPAAAKKGKATATPSADPNSDTADLTSGNFATAWKAHNTELVNYAVAAKDKVDSDTSDAKRNLGVWRQSAASNLKAAAGNKLRSTDVRDGFEKYTNALTDAADSLAKQDGKGYDALRIAAGALSDTAGLLADGFAKAGKLSGDSTDDASTGRAQLTHLLTEHADLVTDVAYAGYAAAADGGMTGAAANAAKASLDANGKDLSAAFGNAANAANQASFVEDWRRHIIDLVGYATATQPANSAGQAKYLGELDTYRATAASFFASISGNQVDATKVAAAFATQFAALTADIRALAAALPPSSGSDDNGS
jgi:hypothetical protein